VAKDKTSAPDLVATSEESDEAIIGKGRPTPTRKEREAANKRPLVGDNSKEARKASKERLREAQMKARVGAENGDERYLTARDKGPQRRFVRDYVDARWSIGEFVLPIMLVFVLLTFVMSSVQLSSILLSVMLGFLVLVVLDSVFVGMRITKKLGEKFGPDKVERGLKWYAAMRATQMRRLRLPKPQVKRGEYPK
jgi:hypothetical protein